MENFRGGRYNFQSDIGFDPKFYIIVIEAINDNNIYWSDIAIVKKFRHMHYGPPISSYLLRNSSTSLYVLVGHYSLLSIKMA